MMETGFSAEQAAATTEAVAAQTLVTREHLRTLWYGAPLAVWVHVDLRVVYVNPAGVRLLSAASESEVVGRSPMDFVVEEDRPELLRRQREAVQFGRLTTAGRLRFRGLDGRVFEVQKVEWPVLFEGRRAVQATFYDLTRSAEAERALVASRAAVSELESIQVQILEAMPGLVWRARPDGGIEYLNRHWYDFTGAKPDALTTESWAGLLHPADAERVLANWHACLRTGAEFRAEYRLLGKEGEYRWFVGQARALRDQDGKITRWFGVCTDVDEQRRASERLSRSEQRFRTATLAISDILWTNDTEGRMRGEQPGWAAFTGQSLEEYQGHGWAKAVHPDDAQPTIDAWNLAVSTRSMFQFEHRVRRHDGVWRLFSIRALPVCKEDGTVREWVGVHTDITDRRAHVEEMERLNAELEERVRQRTAELEASNRELEAFSYSVSHDLRAPLRTIDGFSHAIEEDSGPTLDEESRAYLRRIRQAVQRMGGLIDALLQLSRVTRAEMQIEDVDLSRLAEEVGNGLRGQWAGRWVDFRVEPGIVARADARLAQVVLENLLGNAWKFTSKKDHAQIEFGAREADDSTEYFVRDNGAGFDAKYAGKLFTAFQRLHGDKDFQGSGIGLATVQRVVRRHGGRVRAEGAPDQGATFSFTLG